MSDDITDRADNIKAAYEAQMKYGRDTDEVEVVARMVKISPKLATVIRPQRGFFSHLRTKPIEECHWSAAEAVAALLDHTERKVERLRSALNGALDDLRIITEYQGEHADG